MRTVKRPLKSKDSVDEMINQKTKDVKGCLGWLHQIWQTQLNLICSDPRRAKRPAKTDIYHNIQHNANQLDTEAISHFSFDSFLKRIHAKTCPSIARTTSGQGQVKWKFNWELNDSSADLLDWFASTEKNGDEKKVKLASICLSLRGFVRGGSAFSIRLVQLSHRLVAT